MAEFVRYDARGGEGFTYDDEGNLVSVSPGMMAVFKLGDMYIYVPYEALGAKLERRAGRVEIVLPTEYDGDVPVLVNGALQYAPAVRGKAVIKGLEPGTSVETLEGARVDL